MKTLDLRDHLSSLVDEGRELQADLIKHMSGSDVHKLRVSFRKIRTCTALLGNPLSSHDKKHLKKVWRRLGKVRDLDVSKKFSESFHLKTDSIVEKRHDARRKLKHVLEDQDTETLLDHLEKLSLQQQSSKVNPIPHISELRADLIHSPAAEDNLHALRIVLKKIRYLAETLSIGVEAFKEFQDVLGEVQDLEQLHKHHPHSLEVHREKDSCRKRAQLFSRPALTLGFRMLGELERLYESHHAGKASAAA